MAFQFQDKSNDSIYNGRHLELVIDEDTDVGEVYLDGDLIFQADDVFSDFGLKSQFKAQFEVIEADPDGEGSDSIEVDDEKMVMTPIGKKIPGEDYIDYDDPGLQENLYTSGGEFATDEGREFIGDYHIHPSLGPMIGKYHTDGMSGILAPLSFEDVRDIRIDGAEPHREIDYSTGEEYGSEID